MRPCQKKRSSTGWQGLMEHVYQTSGYISKKRRGHWMLQKIGEIRLNHPVYQYEGQIQLRNHVLDHAAYALPTRRHELHRTDQE